MFFCSDCELSLWEWIRVRLSIQLISLSLSLALLFFREKFIGRSLATEEEDNYNDSRGTKHRLDFLREMRHICRRNR